MKRTKDGGAILEPEGIKLTKYEFERGRLIRDMIRTGAVGLTAVFCLIFTAPIELVIAIIFLAIGWRLKAGW